AALPFLVRAVIQNAGQTCSAGSRVVLQREIYDEVAGRLAQAFGALRVGPAMADLDVGPLVSARQREIVEGFLAHAPQASTLAQAVLPDDLPKGGVYVRPTLLGPIDPDSPLAQQEIFGPVLVLMPFEDEAEAIRLANGTPYGLVASVWTTDGARQMRMAQKLRAGQVFLNNYGAGGGVELPFGGTGLSGHGREKGFEALYGFTTLKTVAARHG
ncbi:MAG: aldehyde dehydrogenase family protein, partial [Pseudomonadota bacterium]